MTSADDRRTTTGAIAMGARRERMRVIALFATLAGANAIVWLWAFVALRGQPALIGSALLAWTLGLRHAVDPDHIAAIDNVTRKLVQDGQRPLTVGLWFALGHSTVVIGACAAIALLAAGATAWLDPLREVGSGIGAGVSTLFLLVIGVVNLTIFLGVLKTWRRVRAGGAWREEDLDALMRRHGILARLLRPLFACMKRSWHMYPLGLLFGLGFDTATEIGVFALAAANASDGVSFATVMIFPALFTAGMTIADAADGALMLGAYGWAQQEPERKLAYNLVITGLSVAVALAIGLVQGASALGEHFHAQGASWRAIDALRQHFDVLGYVIVALCVCAWTISLLLHRAQRRGARA